MCRRVLTRVFVRLTRRFVTPGNHRGYLRLAKALIRLLRSAVVHSECAGWSISSYKFYCRFCHEQTQTLTCANLNAKHPGYNFQQTTFWNIFLILQENIICISCKLSPLHETSNPVFLVMKKKKKKENKFNLSSAELAQKTLSRRCARFIQCVSFTR